MYYDGDLNGYACILVPLIPKCSKLIFETLTTRTAVSYTGKTSETSGKELSLLHLVKK